MLFEYGKNIIVLLMLYFGFGGCIVVGNCVGCLDIESYVMLKK